LQQASQSPQQQAPQQVMQPMQKPRGRPPKKRHFKGTPWHSMQPTEDAPCQQQPSNITDDDGPLDLHDSRNQRSTRDRRQRQFYDASTGDSVNPCG
jgi:hypothetical protein